MPGLHVIIPKDLKRWLETRAKREGDIDGSVSRLVRKVLTEYRNTVEAQEAEAMQRTPTERS